MQWDIMVDSCAINSLLTYNSLATLAGLCHVMLADGFRLAATVL